MSPLLHILHLIIWRVVNNEKNNGERMKVGMGRRLMCTTGWGRHMETHTESTIRCWNIKIYIISVFSSRESLCRFTLLTSTQYKLFEFMQLRLRHCEGGLLKVNHWIVTPQQHRFALGLHFLQTQGDGDVQQLAPARLMHTPGTKLLSGVSNGSVWVWGR